MKKRKAVKKKTAFQTKQGGVNEKFIKASSN